MKKSLRRLLMVFLSVAALLGALPAASALAAEPPLYTDLLFENKASGKCMNIPNGATFDGAPVTQFSCGVWADHKWMLHDRGNGWYQITNGASGKCLAVPHGTTTRGVQLIIWPCGGYEDHHWRFVEYPDGKRQVVNMKSGQCLAVRDGNRDDHAAVIQWPCGSWPDHFWKLVAV
ncbi:hypothetical protein GCM10022243_42730 [Saccharothrix violaceirubra]|uniref:Ricin B lectin domain-containing protein n=1 Tax=Saccharothrix violaceirubra TaxID=413306 RepID=A0A7W7T3F1_9PSEU|nr:RICIN domain-containing protein [Saccharothrix violaceirubra]MBB4965561.1 hypothetical protein [Saccharothrix violaceirubra]